MNIVNGLNVASAAVLGELDALVAGREDETKPTPTAYSNARRIVELAYSKAVLDKTMPAALPVPFVTTDDLGGIRLIWHTETKRLRANFGATADLRSYLYHATDSHHDVEPLDEDHLAERLAWLTK
jgi:hypothetical protein